MNRKHILPPAVALLGGAVGFALRKWQLSAGFETSTGLAVRGAPSALALTVWSAAVVLVLALLCRSLAGELPAHLDRGKGNSLYITLVLASGMLLLVSAGLEALNLSTGSRSAAVSSYLMLRLASSALPPLKIALSVGGLLCAGLWGRAVYRGSPERIESLPLLELCLLVAVWLISDYQKRSVDPVVMSYLYDVLAILAGLMALYYLAGYSFHEPKPGRALFFSLLGPYFCLVALADSHPLYDTFRYGFAALFLTAHALFVLLNFRTAPVQTTETEAQENG